MKLLFLSLFILSSCNPLKSLSDGETSLDDNFFEGGGNSDLYHNLVSFWRFEETGSSDNRVDSQGSNTLNHAVGVISSRSGKNGNAIDCSSIDGSNTFSSGSTTNLNYGTNTDFTISFWVYLDSFIAGRYVAYFTDYNITLSGSNDITFWMNSITTSVPVTTGTWEHVTFVVDRDSGVTAYNNGNYVTFTANDTTGINVTDALYAICSLHDATVATPGGLDSFGIWNRQLSDSEVSDLYNGYNNLD
jgi:hypothetical protein